MFQNVRRADDRRRTRGYTGVALNPQRGTALPSPVVPPKSGAPSTAAMRRVLRRARDGVALNVDEAAIAMTARGDDLADLCASAARVRDAGLTSSGRRGPNGRLPVSYSRKVFIPITHLCRDTCHYCTFVTVPGKLRAQGLGMYMEPDEILDVARRGAELGCKEALFTLGDRPEDAVGRGAAVARRARLRLDTGLRAGDGDPRAGRDRPSAAPEPGRDDVVGAVAAQAGRPVDGDDAGDHLAAAVRDQGAGALRQPGQGPRGSAADAGRRRAAVDSVHHRPAGRHRRDADRARRDAARDPAVPQGVRSRPGSDRAELPGQGSHRDGVDARRRHRRLRGDGRRRPAGAGTQDAHPGTAESGVARRVPGPDRRRRRRLGRRVTADPRSRQPRTAVAGVGRAGRGHRRGGLRPRAAVDRPAAVRAGGRGVDRPARAGARRRPGRPRHRLRVGRQSRGAAVAGARRGRPSRSAGSICIPPSMPRAG